MSGGDLTGAKRRLVERLKRVEHATAPELALLFGLTDTAVRQHLEALEQAGLVTRTTGPASGRGRPPVQWRLAAGASSVFPDRHGDLSVDLVESIRSTLGEDALDAVLAARTTRQLRGYRRAVPDSADVRVKVRRLAAVRSAEGYLAEAVDDEDGSMLLIEHHCPIADAAGMCRGLCRNELELFRATLGPEVEVEREQHLLSGSSRCAYRIVPKAS